MNNNEGKIWYGIGIDTAEIQKDAQRANNALKGIGDKAEAEGSRIDNTMKRVGGAIAAAFTIQQASLFIQQVANIRGEFQQLEIAFTTMLKSKEKADQLMKEIVTFAATTPFDLKGVASGAKQLLAYGFEADSMTENLTMLGNVAAGVGSQIGDIIYLYGTLNAQGKVMTKDLMQFAGRGIPIYKELAAVLKTNENGVMDMASSGKIAFKDVEQAFKNMVSEQGMFYNLMHEQSKSITGQISNLGDAIDSMFNEIGQSSEGLISSAISGASYLVENYKEIGKVVAELVVTYGVYKAAVITMSAIENLRYQATLAQMAGMTKMQVVTDILRTKTEALNKALILNPYFLAAAGIAALAYGTYKLITYQTEAEKQQAKLNDTFEDTTKAIDKEQVQIDTLFARLKSAKKGTEEYDAAKKAIFSKYGEYLKKLGDENTALNNIDAAYKAITESAANAARAKGLALVTDTAAADLVNNQAKILTDLKETIENKYGKDTKKSLEIFYKLKPAIISGEGMKGADKETLSLFDKWYTVTQGDKPQKHNLNQLAHLFTRSVEEKKLYNDIIKNAEELFGESPVKETKTPPKKTVVTELTDEEKKAIEDRKKLLAEISKDELEQIRKDQDLIYQARQSKIDAMKPSTEMELEQLKLDHERKITEINRQQEDLLTITQENAEKVWKANGGKGKFDKSSVKLSVTQVNAFEEMRDNEVTRYLGSVNKVYKELHDKYLDYTEKRKAIEEKFQKDIEALEKLKEQPDADVDKINSSINEAKRLRTVELNELDAEIANRSEAFKVWVNEITSMGLKELVSTLQSAKDTLASSADLSDDDKAVLRAKIEALQKQIEILQAKDPSGSKGWTDTLKTMNEVNESIENIIGGFEGLDEATKSILSAATNISGAVISSISGIMALSVTGAEAIKGVERASVILAVIGAAISIVTTMINLFNTAAKKRREEEEAAIERQRQEYLGLIDYNNELRNKYEWTKKIGEAELDYIRRKGEELAKQKKANEDEQADLYAKLQNETYLSGYETKAKFGTIYFGKPKAGDPGTYQKEVWSTLAGKTFEEISELAAQGKLSEEAQKYYEYLKKAKEEGADIEQIQLDYLQSLKELATGTTAQSITDSIIEGFKAGKKSAADFADTFEQLMHGAVQSALKQMTDKDVLAYYEEFAKLSGDGLNESEIEYLRDKWNELISTTEQRKSNLESVTGVSISDIASREASAKGFASMSQDSADELNGRFTAIQGHTFSIVEGMKTLQANSSQALKYLAGIETNTARLEKIETTMNSVKSGIDDINNKGLLLRG